MFFQDVDLGDDFAGVGAACDQQLLTGRKGATCFGVVPVSY